MRLPRPPARITAFTTGEGSASPGYAARVIRVVIERESVNSEPVVTVLRKMVLAPRTND